MSTTRIVIVALALILLTAGPAAANDPPGPQTVLAEILILPLMMLLSLAGGAYAILEVLSQGKKKRWGAIGRWGGTILVILFSFAHEGFGFMVAVIFAIVAVRRGVQMLWWGMRARPAGPRLAHLQTATPCGDPLEVDPRGTVSGCSVPFSGQPPDRILRLLSVGLVWDREPQEVRDVSACPWATRTG